MATQDPQEEIADLLHRTEELKASPRFGYEFDAWRKCVMRLLESSYGTNFEWMQRFDEIRFVPDDVAINTSEEEFQNAYEKGLKNAIAFLKRLQESGKLEHLPTDGVPFYVRPLGKRLYTVGVFTSFARLLDIAADTEKSPEEVADLLAKIRDVQSELERPNPRWVILRDGLRVALEAGPSVATELLFLLLDRFPKFVQAVGPAIKETDPKNRG